jgi:hypothetical protein
MLGAASVGQPGECPAHAVQLGELSVETRNCAAGASLDGGAPGTWCDSQGEKTVDLLERETESLCLLNECDPPQSIRRILSVTAAVRGGGGSNPRRS